MMKRTPPINNRNTKNVRASPAIASTPDEIIAGNITDIAVSATQIQRQMDVVAGSPGIKETQRGPLDTPLGLPRGKEVECTPTTPFISDSRAQTEGKRNTPNQEFITKMRKEETEAISSIKKELRKMKAALQRQRNISMDVREGVQEIEELVCIAETCRANWLKIEAERKKTVQASETTVNTEMPQISSTKRTASSPAETLNVRKKPCDTEHGWRVVENRKKTPRKESRKDKKVNKTQPTQQQRRQRSKGGNQKDEKSRVPKRKSEAIIAKPCAGHSYADVLKALRKQSGKVENNKVKTIRKTGTGALLIELEKGEQINPELLLNIKEILGEAAEIKSVAPKITIEIRDLDSFTTPEEVEESIRSKIQSKNEQIVIRLTKPNSRELVRAFITVSQETAEELLNSEYIKVGWCRVRLKKYEGIKRCFRCFGSGHEQWNCSGPDRKTQGLCIRCGEPGHMMKACRNEPKCCICTEAGHSDTNHLAGAKKWCRSNTGPK